MSPLPLLCAVLLLSSNAPVPAQAAPNSVIGCPSLANLRILMRRANADATAAAAIVTNDQADHLGCVVLARDSVLALQEHLSLNGKAYDCVSLKNTGICHWVLAGAISLGEPAAKARSGDKPRQTEKPSAPDKARR